MKLKEKYDKITNAEAKSSDISKSKEYLINKVKELSSKGKSMRKIIDIYNAPLISESSKIVYYVILLFLKPTEKKEFCYLAWIYWDHTNDLTPQKLDHQHIFFPYKIAAFHAHHSNHHLLINLLILPQIK